MHELNRFRSQCQMTNKRVSLIEAQQLWSRDHKRWLLPTPPATAVSLKATQQRQLKQPMGSTAMAGLVGHSQKTALTAAVTRVVMMQLYLNPNPC